MEYGTEKYFGQPDKGERGSATVELAVLFPGIVLVLALTLAGSLLGVTQLRTSDAVQAAARSVARNDSIEDVEGTVRKLLGDTAQTSITQQGEWVEVTVRTPVAGIAQLLDIHSVSARAQVLPEPTGNESS